MLEDEVYRMRRDTVRTGGSRDSGIDLDPAPQEAVSRDAIPTTARQRTPQRSSGKSAPKNTSKSHKKSKHTKKHERRGFTAIFRTIESDGWLWLAAFCLTVYMFHLPISIWFSSRTYWPSIYVCLISMFLAWAVAALMYSSGKKPRQLRKTRIFYGITGLLIVSAGVSFCHATWTMFHLWSVYIAFVTTMCFMTCAPLLKHIIALVEENL